MPVQKSPENYRMPLVTTEANGATLILLEDGNINRVRILDKAVSISLCSHIPRKTMNPYIHLQGNRLGTLAMVLQPVTDWFGFFV